MAEGPKYLSCFEGTLPRRGCTVVLQGAPTAQLAAAKRALLDTAFVAYSLQLEVAFLLNEFASAPSKVRFAPTKNCDDLCFLIGLQSPASVVAPVAPVHTPAVNELLQPVSGSNEPRRLVVARAWQAAARVALRERPLLKPLTAERAIMAVSYLI
jgi:hypothetical protein